MKKLLTFLTLLTLSIGVGWAADVTFDATSDKGSVTANGTVSGGDQVTKDGITIISSNGPLGNGANYRVYLTGTLTVSSTVGDITKVVVTCTANNNSDYGPAKFSSNDGNYSYSGKIGTLTVSGSKTSVVLNASAQVRMTSVVVTVSGGSSPQPTTYSLTLPTGLTGGTVTSNYTGDLTQIPSGTSVTVTATANTGYQLSWMKANGTEVENPYTFSITANTTITAEFAEQSVTPTTSTTFERITSTDDLVVGKRYLIVYESTSKAMGAITTSGTKYGTPQNVTLANGVITLTSDSQAKPLTLGGSSGAWTFDLDGALLNHTGTSNTLSTGTSNTTWTIGFSGNNATITNVTNNTRSIRYNNNSGQYRFACYQNNGQEAIQLYKEVESTPTSNKLYLIGYGMNGKTGWNLTTAPEMTYNTTIGTYATKVYFDKAQRGMFQFAKGLSDSDSNWGGLTDRLYPSTNGANINVDQYPPLDGTVSHYFTDQSNNYSFELPAGIYTITANLNTWKTYVAQDTVTVTITNSATFETTKNVTMSSNLTQYGGKIYYTTDGSDPSASSTEYTGTITLEATTTIKAIAILNYIQSEVVEKTYTKAPAAPEISPTSRTFSEPFQVTITAESGADIYYTTDGTDPKDSETRTKYESSFTVSNTTTVKARAFFGEVYGAITTATYTYSNVQPSTDDFELVTSVSQLVEGNEYIIVATYGGTNYAMGALTTGNNPKGSRTTDFTITGTVGTSGSLITAGSDVNVLTLGGTEGAWTLKQSDDSYISLNTGNTNISSTASSTPLLITVDSDEFDAYIGNNSESNTRQILYQAGSANCFGNYASTNVGGNNYSNVYLYTRATAAVAKPVIDPASQTFTTAFDATITCATQGATIHYTTDGSDPTTSSAVYSSPIHVDKTMTIKAIAEKDGVTSAIAEAEYKCTMVENIAEYLELPIGTEGIVFKNPVVVQYHYISGSNKSYIYVKDETGCAYFHQPAVNGETAVAQLENGDVIGALFSGDKDYDEAINGVSQYAMFTNLQNFAKTGSKALAEPELKNVSDIISTNNNAAALNNHYITIKKVKLSNLYDAGLGYGGTKYFDIYDENNVGQAHIGYNKFNIDYAAVVDDLTAYYNITGIFTAYNNNLEFHPTEIVKWAEKEVTLADLCENGEEEESYKITNNLQGVVAHGTSLWVKDDNLSICKVSPTAPYTENFAIEAEGNTRLEQANYDQSNWLEVIFPDAATAKSFENTIIEGYSIEGVFNKKDNPKLTLATNAQVKKYGDADAYDPNYFLPANFFGNQDCEVQNHTDFGCHYFFMTPKPQEYVQIVWAVYDGLKDGKPVFIMSTNPARNSHMLQGEFTADISMNTGVSQTSQIKEGFGYDFKAIIRKVEPNTGNAPALRDVQNDQSASYIVYPLNLDEGQDPVTSINDITNGNGEVKSVKYVNVAGMVSDVPFQGVNIVVTEYTDGSRSTTKMLRK